MNLISAGCQKEAGRENNCEKNENRQTMGEVEKESYQDQRMARKEKRRQEKKSDYKKKDARTDDQKTAS